VDEPTNLFVRRRKVLVPVKQFLTGRFLSLLSLTTFKTGNCLQAQKAKLKKSNRTICWLDFANAFGLLPHDFLHQLFASLPIPTELRDLLSDIYTDSIFQFVVGRELITVHPTSGVRQGDGLSSIIFNLAAEPLIRCAKAPSNSGFPLFCAMLKATAYAKDVSLIGTTPEQLQPILDAMLVVAANLDSGSTLGNAPTWHYQKERQHTLHT
jgi:hypothetical protein